MSNFVLEKLLADPQQVKHLISYQEGSIVSREIIKTSGTTVTLFAFDRGQGLSEHTTPYEALVQIIDGEADITVDGTVHPVHEGEIVIMPAHHPHAVKANRQFKMILTMAR